MSQTTISHTLPIGYMLNDRYCIDSILGEGGFGITYKAIDTFTASDTHYVAIKEYYPSGIAARSTQDGNPYFVTHFDGKLAVSFRKGLERFRQEAYLLKEFSHLESIVSILDIFDSNNTTCIVMEYIEGLTIQKLVRKEGPIPFDEIIGLMKPLLKDLSLIHQKGLIHRDISPDNLLIGMDNRLHLIDFGSANHSNLNSSKTYTVILKAGYAPPEQYIPNGKMGPWTDVYGICATIFYALTGTVPMDSLQRMQQNPESEIIDENLSPIKETGKLEEYQKNAILTGMALSYKKRYPSVSILLNSLTTPPEDDRITEIRSDYPGRNIHSHKNKKIPLYKKAGIVICSISILSVMGYFLIRGSIISDNSDSLLENTSLTDNSLSPDNTDSLLENTSESDIPLSSEENQNNLSKILTMANFTGWYVESAIVYLSSLDSGIQLHTVSEYSSIYKKGEIISQSIQENTQFTRGSITNMVLTVSKGKEPEYNTRVSSSSNNSNNTNSSSGNTSGNSNNKTKNNDGYTVIHIGD